MMTIGSIRTYFDARVKEVDVNLNAWNKDLFGNNDLIKPSDIRRILKRNDINPLTSKVI
jgi:hypothetical protein